MQDGKKTGFALAVILSGISLICGILVYTVPNLALAIAGYLTHSTIPFAIKPFDPVGFIVGLALWAAIGFAIGVAFHKLCGCEEKNKTD